MVKWGAFREEDMSVGIVTSAQHPEACPQGGQKDKPQGRSAFGSLETRASSPSPATDGLADPRAKHFVWYPRLEGKTERERDKI